MKKYKLICLLMLVLSANCYADYATGVAVGLAAGSAMANSETKQNAVTTGTPISVVTICRDGMVATKDGFFICHSSDTSWEKYRCPIGSNEQILWEDSEPKKILCVK